MAETPQKNLAGLKKSNSVAGQNYKSNPSIQTQQALSGRETNTPVQNRYQTTAERFVEQSYAGKGMQPSVGNRPTIRKAEVTYKKYQPGERRGGKVASLPMGEGQSSFTRKAKAANDSSYSGRNTSAEVTGIRAVQARRAETANFSQEGYAAANEPRYNPSRYTQLRQKIKLAGGKKSSVIARLRATPVTLAIGSWGLFVWIVFQVPFAILSAGFLGLGLAYHSVVDKLNRDHAVGDEITMFDQIIFFAGDALSAAAELIEVISGFNFSVLDPMNVFLITWVILIAFFILQTMNIFLLYKFNRLEPLFGGRMSGLKVGVFVLMMSGYLVPILNIFPWFLLWIFVIWLFPK